jgi:hypothetical protein
MCRHLGGAEPVDDLGAEMLREALADLAAASASPADEHSRSATCERAGRSGDASMPRNPWAPVEDGDLLFGPALEDGRGRRPFGHQHGRRADAERERQRVAEAVREEQLRRREADVVFAQAEDRRAVQRRGPVQVGVGVDRAFRTPGRADE